MKHDRALTTSEAVRGRLNVTGAARRDAIERARNRGELPSYTDDDVQEITGQFAALAANAAATATANALTKRVGETPMKVSHERSSRTRSVWIYCLQHPAQVSAAVTGIAGTLAALGRWLLRWW